MNDKQIQQQLDAFYNGTATAEEERLLREFFSNNKEVPEHWKDEQKAFCAIASATEIPLPEGLAERLEQRIDEHTGTTRRIYLRRVSSWVATVAAVGLLCVMMLLDGGDFFGRKNSLVDTYQDPKEAAMVASQALVLMSSNLNKGMSQLDLAQNEMNNVNRILNEQLNK